GGGWAREQGTTRVVGSGVASGTDRTAATKGRGGRATRNPRRRYRDPASASDGSAVPGCGRGPVPTRCQEPQPVAARLAKSAHSPSRLTCPTSNADVSFARSHVQREPRRPDR